MAEYNIQMNVYDQATTDFNQLYPNPMEHASTHATTGDDPITPASIGAQPANNNLTQYSGGNLQTVGGASVPVNNLTWTYLGTQSYSKTFTAINGTTNGSIDCSTFNTFFTSGPYSEIKIVDTGNYTCAGSDGRAGDFDTLGTSVIVPNTQTTSFSGSYEGEAYFQRVRNNIWAGDSTSIYSYWKDQSGTGVYIGTPQGGSVHNFSINYSGSYLNTTTLSGSVAIYGR